MLVVARAAGREEPGQRINLDPLGRPAFWQLHSIDHDEQQLGPLAPGRGGDPFERHPATAVLEHQIARHRRRGAPAQSDRTGIDARQRGNGAFHAQDQTGDDLVFVPDVQMDLYSLVVPQSAHGSNSQGGANRLRGLVRLLYELSGDRPVGRAL